MPEVTDNEKAPLPDVEERARRKALTQEAPDESSVAGAEAARRPNLQVTRGEAKSPQSGSNR
jgi:hypothetical protein